VHSRYNSNYHFTDAMRKGRLDCSCHFMPRIEEYAKDGIRAWDTKSPYHLPASIPTLFLATEKAPFNDVIFRLALIHAIDFDKIARLAFCNYSPPLHPGLILPFGLEACWYSEEDAKRYGYSFSIDKARWLLREEGYTWNTENRLIAPDGKPVRPLSVECPSGWTDWENAIRIAIDGFRALGIDASEQFINYGLWNQHAVKGTFDMLMRTSTAELWPSTPWRRFQQLLSSKNYRPVGQEMTDNFGRYRNATVDSLLEFIPRTTDPRTLRELYRQLNIIFMREAPVLPLGYRPAVFYQFSEKHWTGFPTAEHPSAPPQMLMIGAGIKGLWGIRPVKEAL
jgi:peptide/nickel transport system substrate-binding protein